MIINANALHIPLADKSVQCVVTSPPYYGLRDYGISNQLGLEPTPEQYIANMVAVFREVYRVLKDDGVLWLNIGDSYASMKSRYNQKAQNLNGGKAQDNEFQGNKTDLYHHPELGLKDKDLIGIPWMLAFALRADGWYLRQDIIWHKPNPMPESVKDRCTKSHEYIFLLSKSARYYYDNEAVKEPVSDVSMKRAEYGWDCDRPSTKNGSMNGEGIHTEKMGARFVSPAGRNKRDVWTVTTKPYKGAHYATFNPELIKPCILAGAPEGGIVFDPFVGSGTTVATAIQLGRKGIGLDLSLKYLDENARVRIDEARLPLLSEV